MHSSRWFLFTALAALPWLHGNAATFRVGAGGGCTHATIQAAIDAAADTPETDAIRVTRSLDYHGQALEIEDQNLVLDGAFSTCATEFSDDQRATLNGDGDHSVLKIRGNGDVVLSHLTITGGHEPLFDYGYGGGIQISGGPHMVSLDHVLVTGNEAGHGGGISVRNEVSGDPNQVQLVLGDDTVISFNDADFAPVAGSLIQGGGIYCFESSIKMIGGGSTSINSNTARMDGGGIGAVECDLTIAPHGTFGSFNGLVLNEAGRDGGGLAIEGFSGGGTKLYGTDPNRPVYVSGNFAGREGGGFKVNTDAVVRGWDLIVDGNRSHGEGGAVSVFGGDGALSSFEMFGSLEEAPAGAVNCAAAQHCNRIVDNIAADESGVPQAAAALRVRANGGFDVYTTAFAEIHGTRVEHNSGLSLVLNSVPCDEGDQSRGRVSIDGASITGNVVSQELMNNVNTYSVLGFCDASLAIKASTLAGNTIGGAEVIRSREDVFIARSVIWQPGKRMLEITAGDLEAGSIHHVLGSDLIGIPPSTTNFSADPRFIDPDDGDFHLHASSPGIDYAPASSNPPDSEGDDLSRVVNLALVPDLDGFGPQDLGAYERHSIGNLVRNAEFDEDLHIWTDAAPAATNWGGQDHAGSTASGSIEIFDTSTATRVVGLRQCVGIPGPGVYKLSGFSWIHGDRFLPTPDHAILAWTVHPDSADCTGAAFGSGESQAPNAADWRAIPPQFIAVAPADWTPNTTIGIELIQEKTANTIGSDSDLVRFDGIALVPDTDVIFADGFDGI